MGKLWETHFGNLLKMRWENDGIYCSMSYDTVRRVSRSGTSRCPNKGEHEPDLHLLLLGAANVVTQCIFIRIQAGALPMKSRYGKSMGKLWETIRYDTSHTHGFVDKEKILTTDHSQKYAY